MTPTERTGRKTAKACATSSYQVTPSAVDLKPLAVRAVLPAKHLPKRVFLEQGDFVEVPLVHEENIHGILGDQNDETRGQCGKRGQHNDRFPLGP